MAALAALTQSVAGAAQPSWLEDQPPFKIFGNTYYVGTRGLSAVLVTSAQGHVLIDGTLPETAQKVAASIQALGFKLEDVKFIVNSHAHSDHAGGLAHLQHLTGARVVVSPAAADTLRRGRVGAEDPQFESGDSFPAVTDVATIQDGEVLSVADTDLTVIYTPGHTAGGTSWRWRACEVQRCVTVVYADSLNAVSDESFRFSGDPRNPQALAQLQASIARIEGSRCDILIAAHPESGDLWTRLQRRQNGEPDALIDTNACRDYARAARARLQRRLEQEQLRR